MTLTLNKRKGIWVLRCDRHSFAQETNLNCIICCNEKNALPFECDKNCTICVVMKNLDMCCLWVTNNTTVLCVTGKCVSGDWKAESCYSLSSRVDRSVVFYL